PDPRPAISYNRAMRTLLAALLLSCVSASYATVNNDFQSRINSSLIQPFALDLGGVLGAASVDNGRGLGFPGFEAGVVRGVQTRADKSDLVLRGTGVGAFGVPLVQGAVGLPLGFDLMAHGMKYSGVGVVGGGVRYNVFKAPVVGGLLPTVGVAAVGDKIT